MATADATFTGSIPAIYEENLVPLLFVPYAEDIAMRVGDVASGSVLETAAGTGIVTRALARRLPTSTQLTATDLNEAMLAVASKVVSRQVTWKAADAQRLPFANATFNAVVCQFGMMFLPDKDAGYAEARRVLASRGRFVFNVWDKLESNRLSNAVDRAVKEIFPADPPRFFERTPFGYNDPEVLRAAALRAGFTEIEIAPVDKTAPVASALAAAKGLCMGTPLRGEIEARAPGRLEEITTRVADALVRDYGPGSFEHAMRALVVTATA